MPIKKLFKRDHSFTLCKYVFYYFKLFGNAPFTFDNVRIKNSFSNRWLFKDSRVGVVYNIFLIFMVVISCSYGVFHRLSDPKVLRHKIIDVIGIILTHFTAIFILVKLCVQQKKVFAMANKINSIRESLMLISGELLFEKHSVVNGILQKLVAVFVTTCLIIVTTPIDNVAYVLFHSSFYPSYYIYTTCVMQYSVTLQLIHKFFKLININLLHIFNVQHAHGSEATQMNNLGFPINKITQLRGLYASLSDASQDLSDFYCWPMLMCTLHAFMTLIGLSYYTVSPITIGKNDLGIMTHAHLIAVELLSIIVLIILTTSVTTTIDEVF